MEEKLNKCKVFLTVIVILDGGYSKLYNCYWYNYRGQNCALALFIARNMLKMLIEARGRLPKGCDASL